MERKAKVELFEQIRREYEFGVGTIRGVAHKLRVHRRLVRQALASAEPPERKQVARERPVIGRLGPYIDAILEADHDAAGLEDRSKSSCRRSRVACFDAEQDNVSVLCGAEVRRSIAAHSNLAINRFEQ